ncbi:MAG: hypothetical protein D6705_15610 [Deltaproteobacteria bacterium]|nr:MAG: hypothetical protein D6705_15610 [Deltaproteobacteria bacterium]
MPARVPACPRPERRAGRLRRHRRRMGAVGVACVAALAVPASACAPERRLRAVHGCGTDDAADRLRISARGDFASSPVFVDDDATLPPLPDRTRALTVEGLVGEDPVAVGRTGPLGAAKGDLAVYYARADGLCAVVGGGTPRSGGAVGGTGAIAVYAGGRTPQGNLVGDVVATRRDEATARVVATLPIPSAEGFVVGEDRDTVWIVGGIGPAGVVASGTRIDLDSGTVGDPVPLWTEDGPLRIAGAATVPLGEGRTFVAGGCAAALDGVCDPSSAQASTWMFAADDHTLSWDRGPPLPGPRFHAFADALEDGTVFLAGGVDDAGNPVREILRVADGGVVPFGGAWTDLLAADEVLAGFAAAAPAAAIVVTDLGRWIWVGPDFAETIAVGVGLDVPRSYRTVHRLPGERFLAGDVILPLAVVGADATVDQGAGNAPAFPVQPTLRTPGPRRFAAAPVPLEDGTVVLFGGFDASSEMLATGAFVRRLRPGMDGPDEVSTSLGGLAGALMAGVPGVALAPGGEVRLPAGASQPDMLAAGVHVRGLRGTRLRFGAVVTAMPDDGVRLVHGTSRFRGIEFAAGPQGVSSRRVGPGAAPECTGTGTLGSGQRIELEADEGSYTLRIDGATALVCTIEDPPFGYAGMASGDGGEARVRELSVARLPP